MDNHSPKLLERVTAPDVFVGVNAAFFAFMCATVYRARFVAYFGEDRLEEFFLYAILIICAIAGLWGQFRKIPLSPAVLIMVEIGILIHFTGGLVFIDGKRLYDHYFLGMRYDKYVHLVNAFAVVLLVQNLFILSKLKLRHLRDFIVLFVVLGLGAMVEMFEYIVTRHLPQNGVGGYDNNMQDLIANVVGGFVALVAWRLGAWRLVGKKGE